MVLIACYEVEVGIIMRGTVVCLIAVMIIQIIEIVTTVFDLLCL